MPGERSTAFDRGVAGELQPLAEEAGAGAGVEDRAAGREVAGEEGEADRRVAVAERGHLGVVGGGPGVVGAGDLGGAGGGVDGVELVRFTPLLAPIASLSLAGQGLAVDGVGASIVMSGRTRGSRGARCGRGAGRRCG